MSKTSEKLWPPAGVKHSHLSSLLPAAGCEQCSAVTWNTQKSHFGIIFLLEQEDFGRTGFWAALYPGYQTERCWGLSKSSSPRQPGLRFIFLQNCFCWASCAEMQGEKRRICLKTALGRNEISLYGRILFSRTQLTKGSHRHFRPSCKMRFKIPSQSNFCRATEPCPCGGFVPWPAQDTSDNSAVMAKATSPPGTLPDTSTSISAMRSLD